MLRKQQTYTHTHRDIYTKNIFTNYRGIPQRRANALEFSVRPRASTSNDKTLRFQLGKGSFVSSLTLTLYLIL